MRVSFFVVMLSATTAMARDVSVGTFTKSTSPAPATQVVAHGLGQVPAAVLFWTAGQVSDGTVGSRAVVSVGFCDQAGCSSVGGAIATDAGSFSTRVLSSSALLLRQSTAVAEAALVGWDASNLTLRWSQNTTQATQCHFVVFGSTLPAAAVRWQRPTTSPTGNVAVTSLGFRPEVVLSIASGHASTTVPLVGGDLLVQMSAAAADGGQWNAGMRASNDGTSSSHWLQSGVTLTGGDYMIPPYNVARTTDFTDAGFSVAFSRSAGVAGQVFSLGLAGVRAQVGFFDKVTAPAPTLQTVGQVGFRPQLLVLASTMDVAQPGIADTGAFGLGVADERQQAFSGLTRPASGSAVAVSAIDTANAVSVSLDIPSGQVRAVAKLQSFDADGFTLRWDVNDGVPTRLVWVALSAEADAGGPDAGPDAGTGDAGAADGGAPDAGTGDGGAADGGTPDAGTSDGGSDDAGAPSEPNTPRAFRVGCACTGGGEVSGLLLLLWVRRRR